MATPPLTLILDTSPLITLCSFRVGGQPAIEHILGVAALRVAETVALEATANMAHPDATVIGRLLETERIARLSVPVQPINAIVDSYTRLGSGERDTIKLAVTIPDAIVVLDDMLAFVVAARFGLQPVLLLDLLVLLVQKQDLNRQVALSLVNAIQSRYSAPFVEHTKVKLSEVRP